MASAGDGFGKFSEEFFAADGEDASGSDSEEVTHYSRGRKRVEDIYGEALLEFVRSYVMSYGEMKLSDKHRVVGTVSAFSCPLTAVSKAAKEAGFEVSRTTIRNLFEAPRKNSQGSSQHGQIAVKIGAVTKTEREYNDRGCYSGNNVKMCKQFLYDSGQKICSKSLHWEPTSTPQA